MTDRLNLIRTKPVQGKPVTVKFQWNDTDAGLIELPFTGWLKFKSLLQKGMEMDAREGSALGMKFSIGGTTEALAPETPMSPARPEEPLSPPPPSFAQLLAQTETPTLDEDEDDEDIKAVERLEAVKEASIRNARKEN